MKALTRALLAPLALLMLSSLVPAASAADIQSLLSAKNLTSSELVEKCLQQIEGYDRQGPKLRAMISITPKSKLRERADFLDKERQKGRLRGPLHGIPIILKVTQ